MVTASSSWCQRWRSGACCDSNHRRLIDLIDAARDLAFVDREPHCGVEVAGATTHTTGLGCGRIIAAGPGLDARPVAVDLSGPHHTQGSGVVELSAASIGSVGQVGSLVLPALRPQALNPRSMSGAATKPRMLASFSKTCCRPPTGIVPAAISLLPSVRNLPSWAPSHQYARVVPRLRQRSHGPGGPL